MLGTKIFRLFVSSTFSDFQFERAVLQNAVFPRVRRYCERHGATFQPIDLRWGIGDEQARDRQTMQICLAEIERSRLLSPRPNFLALLGDRYGWRPLPDSLPLAVYEAITSTLDAPARADLALAYLRDDNAVPARYMLKATDALAACAGGDAQAAALERRLAQHFRLAARHCDTPVRLKLEGGATHQEIVEGVFAHPDASNHVIGWFRELDGLPARIDPAQPPATLFADYLEDGALDRATHDELVALKAQVRERVDPVLVSGRSLSLDTLAQESPQRAAYLHAFARHVLTRLLRLIRAEMRALEQRSALDVENAAHAHFAAERARDLTGRDAVLGQIARYLAPSKRKRLPLVLTGAGGAGKSSVLAAACANPPAGSVAVARFVGTTAASSALASMIADLCAQLDHRFGGPPPEMEASVAQSPKAALAARLERASAQRPIVLIVDALDQFPASDRAWMLLWLPANLPRHVRVLLSCRDTLTVPDRADSLPLAPLAHTDADRLLTRWLASRARTLTPLQRAAVLDGFAACPLPLWLKLAFERAAGWHATATPAPLPPTLEAMIDATFDALSARHPRALLEHALGYLATSRHGLSEAELARLLAATPEVVEEFRAGSYYAWDVEANGLPPVIGSRLRLDLAPWLTEKHVDGSLLCTYFHREFASAALARVGDARRNACRHRIAALFAAPQGEALLQAALNDEPRALRRFTEQVWQLNAAGDPEAAAATLTDLTYLLAACAARRLPDLLDSFAAARAALTNVPASLSAWHAFLRSNAALLEHARDDWPAHRILLQLAAEEAVDSVPGMAADRWLASGACDWRWFRLRERAAHASAPAVRARFFSTEPYANFRSFEYLRVLEGGRLATLGNAPLDKKDAEGFEGRPGLYDTFVRIWDFESGLVELELHGHRHSVTDFVELPGARIASTSLDGTLRIWSLDDGACTGVFDAGGAALQGMVRCGADYLAITYGECVESRRIADFQPHARLDHGGSYADLEAFDAQRVIVRARRGEDVVERWLWNVETADTLRLLDGGDLIVASATGSTTSPRVLSWSGADAEGPARIAWGGESQELAPLVAQATGDDAGPSGAPVAVRSATSLGDGSAALWLEDGRIVVLDGPGRPALAVLDPRRTTTVSADEGQYFFQGVLRLPNGELCDWHSDDEHHALRRWSAGGVLLADWPGDGKITGMSLCRDGMLLQRFWRDRRLDADRSLERRDPINGRVVARMTGHAHFIDDAIDLPDGTIVSWALDEGVVRTWEPHTGKPRAVFDGRTWVDAVRPLDDGTVLVAIWSTLVRFDCAYVAPPPRICGGLQVGDAHALTWEDDQDAVLWRCADREPLMRVPNSGNLAEARLLTPDHLLLWDDSDICWSFWKRRGEGLDADGIATLAFPQDHDVRNQTHVTLHDDVAVCLYEDTNAECLHALAYRLDDGACVGHRMLSLTGDDHAKGFAIGANAIVLVHQGSASLVRLDREDPPQILCAGEEKVFDVKLLEGRRFATIGKEAVHIWAENAERLHTLTIEGGKIREAVVARGSLMIASASRYALYNAASFERLVEGVPARGFALTRISAGTAQRFFVEMRRGDEQHVDVIDRAAGRQTRLTGLPAIDADARPPVDLDTEGATARSTASPRPAFAVFGTTRWCVFDETGGPIRTLDGRVWEDTRFAGTADAHTIVEIRRDSIAIHDLLDPSSQPRVYRDSTPLACMTTGQPSVTVSESVFRLNGDPDDPARRASAYWTIHEQGPITALSDLVDGSLLVKGCNGIARHQHGAYWLDEWIGGRRVRDATLNTPDTMQTRPEDALSPETQ
ncbi:hypothetical protein PUN4_50051 [Paraburkholderia unamae]|uniref:AAA family ATPase n=1 Tax=Paraburkholderia unamae TaxID=219649 RepID=UPI001CAB20BB|nr:AAA family ATPase [Paraburkholderia unamae]CAG9265289.1 hypothetical protein PUN4_50051 [Paraburkholderia unamae]